MPQAVRALVTEMAQETLAPRGAVLKLALSVPAALEPWPEKLAYRRAAGPPPDGSALTRRALPALPTDAAVPAPALAKAAGVGAGVVHAMARDGLLDGRAAWSSGRPGRGLTRPRGVELTPAQRIAATTLCRLVDDRGSGVALLDGVPGAGKTEVYFEAVAEALRAGRRVLVLLPEIALSAQWLARFERRFGTAPPSGTRP